MIEKINHYALTDRGGVVDEEAYTSLELAARSARKVNECVEEFNSLEASTQAHVTKMREDQAAHEAKYEAHVREVHQEFAQQNAKINTAIAFEIPDDVETEMSRVAAITADAIECPLAFDKPGYIKNQEGLVIDGSYGFNTGLVRVYGYKWVKYVVSLTETGVECIFFTKDMTEIYRTTGSTTTVERDHPVPPNAYWVILSYYPSDTVTPYAILYNPNDIHSRTKQHAHDIDVINKSMADIFPLEMPFTPTDTYPSATPPYAGIPNHSLVSTGKVDITGYNYIKFTAYLDANGLVCAFYDENMELSYAIRGSGEMIDRVIQRPSKAKYVLITNYLTTDPVRPYSAIAYNVNNLEERVDRYHPKFNTKKMVVFGDSITRTASFKEDGSGYVEFAGNWPLVSKEHLHFGDMRNLATNGARYCDTTTTNAWQNVSHQIEWAANNYLNADIAVLALGTNDGEQADEFESAMAVPTLAELDRTNFSQAVRYAMWKIRATYPDAMCFVMTPIQRALHEPIQPVIDLITKMAERYNFIIIPAHAESGIVRDNEVYQGAGNDLSDGLHTNDKGARKLANLFNSYILKHFAGRIE